MSDLKLKENARKYLRSQVTQWHNKRNTFGTLSSVDKASTMVILKDISNDLRSLDERILTAKWSETENESELNKELERCDSYKKK